MKPHPKIAVFSLLLVIVLVFLLSQLPSTVKKIFSPRQTILKPTPTPILTLTQFKPESNLYTFFYPTEWESLVSSTSAIFKSCNKPTLTINEIPFTPTLKTAAKHLQIDPQNYVYSTIDSYYAILVSDTQSTPSSRIVIEATRAGMLIDISYFPTCNQTLDQGKENYFFELLKYFKFSS